MSKVFQSIFRKSSQLSTQFMRNLVVAGVSFVFDYGVFLSLKQHVHPLLALILGYTAGLFVNYALSVLWVFTDRHYKGEIKQFALFSFYALTGLLVELVSYSIISKILPYQLARLASISIAYFWNFAMKELVVFRRKERVPLVHILKMYRHLTVSEALYLALRFASAPIGRIARMLPEHGHVLEIGMGSGINLAYSAKLHPNTQHYGVDADASKTSLASKIQIDNVKISSKNSLLTSRAWDAILIVDVLYLLDSKTREKLILDCTSSLSTNGVLIVKEMSAKPKMKAIWNKLQERISVGVTGMTYSDGSGIHIWSVEEIAEFAKSKGLKVEIARLDNRYIHPHAVIEIRN